MMGKLKGFILFIAFTFFLQSGYALEDTLVLHNGNMIMGAVTSINHYTVSFKYTNENTEQQLSNFAIKQIQFESGRTQMITEKISIQGEEDWEKVIILEDKEQRTGLKRISDINAHTKFINLHTANSGNNKVTEKLKREAAKLNCPFILINFDRATVYNGLIKSWGAIQEIKKAFCYNY
ncbi:MAG TPA: hypothetical protein VJA82_06365 [Sediminibacterium sp.]|jgi:hypothetical protein|uniref:hypothetical protein n=1 Tax=Sediminibacterium sp. TaxID=1917865 RepID=UPI0008C9FF29|nr:hypothetical protein [Sediminibacterium sp.]OHC85471.1 MAG: hypothetical protein A2472_06840 [Sphingobacteriia bacterium RIFOXYC2_FULL_35_18]OHC87767.1 MAG: hypothetical protein A2546_03800 [Sphingobacteriia bacterium RIFOXYD2_FULL_35_12]OYY08873.1 MAG: hypothetical protein B7Y66_10025 [Sphingobacteriia bacterium 35-36-14]OYZ53996.1 MAG: hypothetical protein B7Y11_07845 [Sphingobacteriia bacterium 24-36-13]OZA64992.1 MAG: hypothetical protein B7X68_05650 [Sphingobacteriia bacterium 39-36-14